LITKPEEHEINRAGKRLLREAVEPLGWVVNDVQEDYGIDTNVQVFDGRSPTGAWFHVQLKSSASTDYAADRTFISQQLPVGHVRHYALEMREPVLLIHADVTSESVYWYSPQLSRRLAEVLGQTGASFITVRIPTAQQLPGTAPDLLASLNNIYLILATRELTSASTALFMASMKHLPDQEALHRAFQEKNDSLKLQRILELFEQRAFDQARVRVETVLADPDSTTEIKFWAQIHSEAIDYTEAVHAGRPQNELPSIILAHAKSLQKLTAAGPKHLKFYSLIARQAAELEMLTFENLTLFMAQRQHLEAGGNPMMALSLYARRSAITRRIVSKYNQCVRLARYAAEYSDRWVLGRALTNACKALAPFLITLRAENRLEAEKKFVESALQISKLAAWICQETGDPTGVVLAIMSALTIVDTTDSDAYRWASQVAQSLVNPEIRADALFHIERAVRRWKGESVEGDYQGDTSWQIFQNMATGLGIDVSDENDPLVRGLRIAAKDDSPERVLACCEHIIVGQGATGPIAQRIQLLFNTSMASSKVVHCTLHKFHVEGKELDSTYAEFKRTYCDLCPDQKPRPQGWHYTDEVKRELQARHLEFVARLAGSRFGLRYTEKD
jgi:uncharacterized protein DUF4365